MTPAMLDKAAASARHAGIPNIEFRHVVSALVFFGLLFLFLSPAPGAVGVGALLALNWVAIEAGYHLLRSRPSPGSSRTGSRRPTP